MTGEQEQEFELVLGNKQLFGILFIVLVLLAVFFAMGYVMGRNTTAPEVASKQDTPASSDPAIPVGQRRSPLGAVPAAANSTPLERSEPAPQASTPEPVAAEPARPAPRKETPAPGSVVEPQPGETFWQVSAVAKPEAELLVDVLQKKGFHAIVAPGPNEKLYRVLVGPAKDPADLGKLRTDLENSGFKPMLRKY